MALDAHANFATSLVATAPSPAGSGTSLVVTAGEGARFPTPPFNAVVAPADLRPTPTNAEVVRVTAIATDTLTITRAQESTVARNILVGDRIYAAITKKTLTDIEAIAGLAYTSGTHAARIAAAHSANRLWKETDTGLVYFDNGATWDIFKGAGSIRKTADQDLTNTPTTARVNIADLALPVEANEVWFFQLVLDLSGSSVNADFNFLWSLPAGASIKWREGQFAGGVAVGGTPQTVNTGTGLILGATAGEFVVQLMGWFIIGATAGTCQLTGSQTTQTVEATLVKANSVLLPQRLA